VDLSSDRLLMMMMMMMMIDAVDFLMIIHLFSQLENFNFYSKFLPERIKSDVSFTHI
jgi:hypothetical protein